MENAAGIERHIELIVARRHIGDVHPLAVERRAVHVRPASRHALLAALGLRGAGDGQAGELLPRVHKAEGLLAAAHHNATCGVQQRVIGKLHTMQTNTQK